MVKDFCVGENASVHRCKICSDILRLPCVIAQVTGEAYSLYRLQCSSGVLQRCYGVDDLEPFKGDYSIPICRWMGLEAQITLKEAASKQANTLELFHCQ